MLRESRESFGPQALLLALGLLASAAACNVGDGFASLGDDLLLPDASLLDRPGRRLRSGSYSDLTVDGSLDDGGRVLALRHKGEETGLSIVPFLEGEPCDLFPAVGFERVSSRISLDLGAIVAVKTNNTDTGRGTIRLVDFQCNDVLDAVLDADLPRVAFPEVSPRGLLILNGSGSLSLIDAEKAEVELIAEKVGTARVVGKSLWTIENGSLVERDENLKKVIELGTAVSEFIPGVGDEEVVFVEGGEVFGWTRTDEADGELRHVSKDGCGIASISPKILAFTSPCATGRLIFEVAGKAIGVSEPLVQILGPETFLRRYTPEIELGFDDKPSTFMLIQSDNPDAISGNLRVATLEPGAELTEAGTVELEFHTVAENISIVQGQFLQNWDGAIGDLVELVTEDHVVSGVELVRERITLLPGVDPLDRPGVLLNFDGTTGTLTSLSRKKGKLTEEPLTEGVPSQGIVGEDSTDYLAYVGELDPARYVGKPFLLTESGPLPVGERALVNTLRFLDQPRALAYLATTKGDSGAELHAYLIESGIDLLLADGVNEYRNLPWPSPGILYSVWEGKQAGLWLSKAR